MRRIPAILLVVLYGFSLISAAWFSPDAGSGLPACCRRDGKHHCEMTASRAESSPSRVLQTGKCSFYPVGQAAPANRSVSLAATGQGIFAGLAGQPASRPQTKALYLISYSRAGQKRGPPPSLS
jgi:hypothetical protein